MKDAIRFRDACAAIVGAQNVLGQGADTRPYLVDWSGRYGGSAMAVVRPGSPVEVARLVRLCRKHKVAVVPQGGNTGLCGGAVPAGERDCIVIQLGRMNRLRSVDPINCTLTAEAGMPLATARQAAAQVDRLFPLSLAAEGSCTIGGNLATNAGGTAVLRYGSARDLCLGLEVVTASGEVWNGMRALRKDNSGYALRHLYVGSEGTLGIITAAVLKLYPRPTATVTAIAAVEDLPGVIRLFEAAQQRLGDSLTAFELMSASALRAVAELLPQTRLPPRGAANWLVLIELSASRADSEAREALERLLMAALSPSARECATVSTNLTQSRQMWSVREAVPEAQMKAGDALRYDISLPVSGLAGFVDSCEARLPAISNHLFVVTFGHVGDGNLHFNIRTSAPDATAALEPLRDAVDALVYGLIDAGGGSISAEHGIGQSRLKELPRHKSAEEMGLMRSLKAAFDPQGIMNPGKLLEGQPSGRTGRR